MENHATFQQYPLVWREEEDSITWSPTDCSPGSSIADTSGTIHRQQPDWLWELGTASPSTFNMGQSFVDPAYRLADLGTDQNQHSHSPSIGYTSAPNIQWHPLGDGSQFVDSRYQHARLLPVYAASQSLHSAAGQGIPVDGNHAQIPRSHPVSNDATTPVAQLSASMPWPDVFASTRGEYHNPPKAFNEMEQPQRKAKRSVDDLYTPQWVRNRGTQREGWCGWCQSWHTLRDSTYWYHMHYSHGISQANGSRLPHPAGFRAFCDSNEWEVKCGRCAKWMPLPPRDKWPTVYFRHTYKCYYKSRPNTASGEDGGSIEQARAGARSSKTNL